MKKSLAIVLIITVLTNFHCARLDVSTSGKTNILALCKASFLKGENGFIHTQKGTLILTEEGMLFKNKETSLQIPYQNISSIDVDENPPGSIPYPTRPSFTEKVNRGERNYFLAVALVMILIGFFYALIGRDVDFAANLNTNGGFETVLFKLSGNALTRIYPILMDKADLN